MELSLKGGYSQFWKAIIRPPKDEYELKDLGPKAFLMQGVKIKRTDIELRNDRGHTLQCSFFEPHDSIRPCEQLPCVIYLHGNCSSRRGSFDCLESLLPQYMCVFTFDFSACGLSEGEYISLGWYERDDLQTVVKYLRDTGRVSLIGLWGRSMGAATALLHGHRDPSIAGMVLDSPFAHLKQLATELVSNNTKIPDFLSSIAMRIVRSSIQSKANFDIFELNPIENVDTCFIPAFFIAGTADDFVKSHHTEQIYSKYAGDKQIQLFDGDHNGQRPDDVLFKVTGFFYQTLQCDIIQQAMTEKRLKLRQNAQLPQQYEEEQDENQDFGDSQQRVVFHQSNRLLFELDEEEQLKMAILASLEQQNGQK